LIEQRLTSHQTHYRSYRGRFLQVIWPNQQCQSTEGNQLVLQGLNPTRTTPPCYRNQKFTICV